MDLKKEEIMYYIMYLDKKIKTSKTKELKEKYTEQRNALLKILVKIK